MTPKQIAKAQAELAKKQGAEAPAVSEPEVDVAPERDLDDPATQEAILDPQPVPITVGREASGMFPLPANEQRNLAFSFMPRLMQAAIEIGSFSLAGATEGQKIGAVVGRYAQVLAENQPLMTRFSRYVARAEQHPNEEPDAAMIELRAKLIDRTMRNDELVMALTHLLVVNEVFGSGKPAAPPATATATPTN
jgi:hypothetical protein